MAQTLREALKPKSVSLTHSESLELVARILGFHDWNVLSARIQSERQPTATAPTDLPPISAGARLPAVPLRDIVLLPQMIAPYHAQGLAITHEAPNDRAQRHRPYPAYCA
jgi:ATP-dependent Lon protease